MSRGSLKQVTWGLHPQKVRYLETGTTRTLTIAPFPKIYGAVIWYSNVCKIVTEGPQLPKILYKIVQSLKFSEDCKIIMKDCNLV